MSIPLPKAIAVFVEACNQHDLARLSECMTADVILLDEGQRQQGIGAVKQWLAAAMQRYDYQLTPLTCAPDSAQLEALVLQARAEGNFPGSPVVLSHRFTLTDNMISQLEVH